MLLIHVYNFKYIFLTLLQSNYLGQPYYFDKSAIGLQFFLISSILAKLLEN